MIRLGVFLFMITIITSCSLGVYTPVIAASAAGFDRASLKEHIKYKHLIDNLITLEDVEDRIWTLRKFSKGRYFIELSYPDNRSTHLVSRLDRKRIVITDIFEDTMNGGIFYAAQLQGDDGTLIEAPKNHWYEEILNFSVHLP